MFDSEKDIKFMSVTRPGFKPSTAPTSFTFSSHAKEIMKSNVPKEEKGMGKERKVEEKKVKANGKRGRGKGATE